MIFKTDNYGVVDRCEVKAYHSFAGSWGQRLPELDNKKKPIHIITYSLANPKYINALFLVRSENIFLICHSTFEDQARKLKRMFPKLRVAIHPETHVKLVLTSKEVFLGSANFGASSWHETVIGIKSAVLRDHYRQIFKEIWSEADEVTDTTPLKDYTKIRSK